MEKTAIFGGGCFWCTEAVFRMLKGVAKVEPGYAGGTGANPSYEQVSGGKTGHAEVIRITYDPTVISYEDLLTVFFGSHDPTTPDRQGADVGPQYRSVVFYQSEEERAAAEKMIMDLSSSLPPHARIVTQLTPLGAFFKAEEYHREYYEKNPTAPYCELVIEPKLEKVRSRFAELIKQSA